MLMVFSFQIAVLGLDWDHDTAERCLNPLLQPLSRYRTRGKVTSEGPTSQVNP